MKVQTNTCLSYVLQALIMAVITFLLLEVIGLLFYYQEHGKLFYSEEKRAESVESQSGPTNRVLETKLILHPFLGFSFRPSLPISRVADAKRIGRLLEGGEIEPAWINLTTNNHGFYSDFDYPYAKKSPRELIVGIFGGSVAHWFALQGAERLKEELQGYSYFNDRDIKVLNYAQGGFKQPQQLQALSYFLAAGQEFDVVVNIDGFNEVALTHINHKRNIDTSMPSAQHLLPLLWLMSDDTNIDMIDKILGLRKSELDTMRVEQWRSSTRSAGLYLILSMVHNRGRSEYPVEQKAVAALSKSRKRTNLVHVSNLPDTFTMSDSMSEAMEFWLGAAVTMQEICNSNNILYMEVIQPNQYFSEKNFSPSERELAINKESPYREAVELGYPYLTEHVRLMRKNDVNVLSAVEIFDGVDEQTYSDSCCHFNQTGNEILATRVAESIITLVEERDISNP